MCLQADIVLINSNCSDDKKDMYENESNVIQGGNRNGKEFEAKGNPHVFGVRHDV